MSGNVNKSKAMFVIACGRRCGIMFVRAGSGVSNSLMGASGNIFQQVVGQSTEGQIWVGIQKKGPNP